MRGHIHVIAWLNIVLSSLSLLVGGAMWLLLAGVGTAIAVSGEPGSLGALAVLGGAGTLIAGFFLALSLPGIIIGWGMLRLAPWARIAGIVFAILSILHVPFGTAVGIYTLVVLFNQETIELFEGRK